MKYFYDTEFHESGPGRPIELISIAIVADDGRELYMINEDFDWEDPKHDGSPSIGWLRQHVMPGVTGERELAVYGQLFPMMASQIIEFFGFDHSPRLWSYFSAYDHVLLCQIFGRMVDLPYKSMMITHDLKHEMVRAGVTKKMLPEMGKRHLALDDARWIKGAFESLCTIRKRQTERLSSKVRRVLDAGDTISDQERLDAYQALGRLVEGITNGH